jgi:L-methionine (R)-S-oxide reductase
MASQTKLARYARLRDQIVELIEKTGDPTARRATAVAVLHHKLPGVSWTGFYMLRQERLVVDVYQGPVACLELQPPNGVCWSSLDAKEPIVVDDVADFSNHVPCDPLTRSELVLPHFNRCGEAIGVLDLDSRKPAHFDAEDQEGLGLILQLLEEPC